MGIPLYVTCYFSLAAFNILSLILATLITICFGVVLLWLILFLILCASCTWMSVSFPRLGKVLPNMSSICSHPLSLFFLFLGLLQYFAMVKKLPANAGDARDIGLISVSGRSPKVENSKLF